MDATTYNNFKVRFRSLTGKDADENLEAYIAYLNLLVQMDIKDRLTNITTSVSNLEKKN